MRREVRGGAPGDGGMADETPYGLSLEPDRVSRHSLGIHASPAEVYRALTDPAELVRWFVSVAEVDLRPGGAIRWVFGHASGDPGPQPLVTTGEFVAVVKHEMLRLKVLIDDFETELEFRIDAWRDGAVLTVTHSGFPGDEEWDETFRAIDRGWQTEVHALKMVLERGHGMLRSSERHVRRIDASAEDVFAGFTTKAGLEMWLADRAALDATPGGEFQLEWKDREALRGHFAVCDPDRFLLMTWEGGRPSLVRLHLDDGDEEGGVELTLDHIRFAPTPATAERHDWEVALDRLVAALAVGHTA
jgi:uncharacterized protein YndB with AHSA1/START domain